MAIDLVDYETLERGKREYAKEAEILNDVVKSLTAMNAEMDGAWINETAKTFLDKMNNDYIKEMQAATISLQNFSKYINDYMVKHKDDDSSSASAIM